MTKKQSSKSDDNIPFERRDILKLAGAAGAIGAFGTGQATAEERENGGGRGPGNGREKRTENEYIVGVTTGNADVARRQADSVRKTISFSDHIGQAVVGQWPEQALQGLRRNPNVLYVEKNGEMYPLNHADELDRSAGVDRVNANVAHAFGKTGEGVSIAILDSGIQPDHPDLEANLGEGHAEDGCECVDAAHPDGECATDWDDADSHGTHVAGTAGAIHNGEQVVGVAPEATLHSIKVCRFADPADDRPGCPHDCMGEGLKTAAEEGYDVVNMSLGSCCPDCEPLDRTTGCCESCYENIPGVIDQGLQEAEDAGIVVVSSAGNDGNRGDCEDGCDPVCADNDCVGRPAHDDRAMAVSSTRYWDDALSGFSSVGPEVEIAAPGSSITSTVLQGQTGGKSGTSMAAPHVAGAAALVIEDGSFGTSPDDVKDRLKDTAEDLSMQDFAQGSGLLDVPAALNCPEPTAAFTFSPDVPDEGEEVTFDASDSDVPDPNSIVEYDWSFGDGLAEKTEDPVTTHTYTDWGEFEVTLTVTDEAGQTDETTQEIRVNAVPEAAFEFLPDLPNEGDDVTFDASDSEDPDGDIVEYAWDFGDGTTETTTDPVIEHNYGEAGEGNYGDFEVELTVTDDDDATDTVTEDVRINAYPIAEFEVNVDDDPLDPPENPVVRDEPVTFDASASEDPDGEIVEYAWEFGDGTSETTTDPVIEHTYEDGGEMTVTLTVTDDDDASHEEISVHEETFTVHIRVKVDVKPNEDETKPINLRSNTVIPAAVLHTDDFDSPAELDPDTVRFGAPDEVNAGDGAEILHDGGHVDDVNDSGDEDWHCHFETGETGFDSDDDEAKLAGETHGGVPVFGHDDVRIVGRN